MKRLLLIIGIFFFIGETSSQENIKKQQDVILLQQIENLQHQISILQDENQKLQSEFDIYREDVRHAEDIMNANMALWLAVLTIIMAVLGLLCPYLINRNHTKEIDKQLARASASATEAKQQTDNAEKRMNEIEKKMKDVVNLALTAQKAAKRTEINRLFAEALREKDIEKEIEKYTKILEIDSSIPEVLNNRGLAKSHLKDYLGAIDDYTKAIEGSYIPAYINRSTAKLKLKDYDGAIKDCDKAIELDSKSSNAYNNRANALLYKGEFEQALNSVEISLCLNPQNAVAIGTMSEIYLKMNRLEDALKTINKAISINKEDTELYMHRVQCFMALASKETDDKVKEKYLAMAAMDRKNAAKLKNEYLTEENES
jgi:tetratricopeptide (TPR) repeat protein